MQTTLEPIILMLTGLKHFSFHILTSNVATAYQKWKLVIKGLYLQPLYACICYLKDFCSAPNIWHACRDSLVLVTEFMSMSFANQI